MPPMRISKSSPCSAVFTAMTAWRKGLETSEINKGWAAQSRKAMSALPFRATTPHQALQHQETLCHPHCRSSPSAPSLSTMRSSISNQAESSQHHSFEQLNKQSPVGKSRCWLTPGTKQGKDRREAFVQCLNWATPISQGHPNRVKGVFRSFSTYAAAFS